ncbi:hypothetical protein U1Q18_030908 [Sarracenia purpurea var. burkii]
MYDSKGVELTLLEPSKLRITREDEEMSKSALSPFRAKEEEIEKKKLEVVEKVASSSSKKKPND